MDPYKLDCPLQDQIFSVHTSLERDIDETWQTETQKDQILFDICRWVLEKKQLSVFEKSELTGRKEVLFKLIHLYVMKVY